MLDWNLILEAYANSLEPKLDAAERGVRSGSTLFAYKNVNLKYYRNKKKHLPETFKILKGTYLCYKNGQVHLFTRIRVVLVG